jgi:dual specificity MAP kinase phosphatase
MLAKKGLRIYPLKLKEHNNYLPQNKSPTIIKEECPSPQEIIPGLFLGSFKIAKNLNKIQELEIKGIINVTMDKLEYHNIDINYLQIPINDNFDVNIIDYFLEAHKFIDEHLSRGENVLVHCQAGVSRSATIVISYIMKITKKSYIDSIDIVRKKRNKIDPNLSFISQLLLYEKKIHF